MFVENGVRNSPKPSKPTMYYWQFHFIGNPPNINIFVEIHVIKRHLHEQTLGMPWNYTLGCFVRDFIPFYKDTDDPSPKSINNCRSPTTPKSLC